MAASSLVIKRVSSSSSSALNFFKLFNPVFIPSASRSFITRTVYFNNDDGNVERFSCRCRFPGCAGCNCSKFWGMNPKVGKHVIADFMASPRGEVGSEREKRGSGWDIREDKEAVYFKLELPGMAKEDVKITLENNSIVIKAETDDDDGINCRFSGGMSIPPKGCDIDSIRAEMKNGVLKVTVPKAKDNVRHITIE